MSMKSLFAVLFSVAFLLGPAWGRDDRTIGTMPKHGSIHATAGGITGSDQAAPVASGGAETSVQNQIDTGAPVMTSSWQSGPMTHSVTTPKYKAENVENQAHRHLQSVIALASMFPPAIPAAQLPAGGGYATSWLGALPGFDNAVWCGVSTPEDGDNPMGQAGLHKLATQTLFALIPAP